MEILGLLADGFLLAMQQQTRQVRVEETVSRYMVAIVHRTRSDGRLKLGVSPRGSLMLFRAAQASAFLEGRDYVLPDDVQRVAPHVLPHRLILTPKAKYGGDSKGEIITEILAGTKVPT